MEKFVLNVGVFDPKRGSPGDRLELQYWPRDESHDFVVSGHHGEVEIPHRFLSQVPGEEGSRLLDAVSALPDGRALQELATGPLRMPAAGERVISLATKSGYIGVFNGSAAPAALHDASDAAIALLSRMHV